MSKLTRPGMGRIKPGGQSSTSLVAVTSQDEVSVASSMTMAASFSPDDLYSTSGELGLETIIEPREARVEYAQFSYSVWISTYRHYAASYSSMASPATARPHGLIETGLSGPNSLLAPYRTLQSWSMVMTQTWPNSGGRATPWRAMAESSPQLLLVVGGATATGPSSLSPIVWVG